MSRIGKQPVTIPAGVKIETGAEGLIKVKGPKGELEMSARPEVGVQIEGGEVLFTVGDGARQSRAYHGLTRSLVQNMVEGVTKGYEKMLDIHGVGWNASVQGNKVVLSVGFCHTVDVPILPRTEVACPNPTTIVVSGIDKQAVGQLAASIRAVRPPEPYKGKGIRYKDEYVKMKAGKSFGS